MYFMFPKRDIKVVPISVTSAGPEEHFRFGSAIKSAVEKTDGTVAVLGTGSPVHRLDLIRYGHYGDDKFEPGAKFDEKIVEVIATGDFDRILKCKEDTFSCPYLRIHIEQVLSFEHHFAFCYFISFTSC